MSSLLKAALTACVNPGSSFKQLPVKFFNVKKILSNFRHHSLLLTHAAFTSNLQRENALTAYADFSPWMFPSQDWLLISSPSNNTNEKLSVCVCAREQDQMPFGTTDPIWSNAQQQRVTINNLLRPLLNPGIWRQRPTGEILELLEHLGVHGGWHHILRGDVLAVCSSETRLQGVEVHGRQRGAGTTLDTSEWLQHLG